MPEGPELRLAGIFINKVAAKHLFTGKVIKSDLATKLPEVPFEAENYKLHAESRGKELKVYLQPVSLIQKNAKKNSAKSSLQHEIKHLLFRFGMSGCFKLTSIDEIPKHAHLRFFTKTEDKVLCFVDYRRFGRWTINGEWGEDRGPDPIDEYTEFRQNVLDNLDNAAFNKSICETLLNQKFFNGIGNYLRAEILYRLQIPPFTLSRSVLQPLREMNPSVKTENPDILDLCHLVPKEVLNLGGGKGYDVDHDPEEEHSFNDWLQCYYQDGMNNLVDHNGRTIWFQGPAGPMKPSNAKARGKRTKNSKKTESANNDDHDYDSPKKKVKKENVKQESKKDKSPKKKVKKENVKQESKEDESPKKKVKKEKVKQEPKEESFNEDVKPTRRSSRNRSQ